jgi:hypothetical protein
MVHQAEWCFEQGGSKEMSAVACSAEEVTAALVCVSSLTCLTVVLFG